MTIPLNENLNKICVAMQPTYLPWSGFFNLVAQADIFIFHDDVQIQKQSWHNRNRILMNGEPFLLTVPCRRKGAEQLIMDVETEERPGQQNWRKKHARQLVDTYRKHRHADIVQVLSEKILDERYTKLADLNIMIIEYISENLGLKPRFFRASSLNFSDHRTAKLVHFCKYFGCSTYLSPLGSAQYLAEDGDFAGSSVALEFQAFEPQSYPQHKQPEDAFISHLSIVDVLANIGWENTSHYVKTGAMPKASGMVSG